MAFVGNGNNDADILIWDAASNSWQPGPQSGGGTDLREAQTFDVALGTNTNNDLGSGGTSTATALLVGANFTVDFLTCYCITNAVGNVQMGIYDGASGNLLVSTGAPVALTLGANTLPVAPTIVLGGGLYYFALWNDNNQPQFIGFGAGNQGFQRLRDTTAASGSGLPASIGGFAQINDAMWILGTT